jgi:hypothetical protein
MMQPSPSFSEGHSTRKLEVLKTDVVEPERKEPWKISNEHLLLIFEKGFAIELGIPETFLRASPSIVGNLTGPPCIPHGRSHRPSKVIVKAVMPGPNWSFGYHGRRNAAASVSICQ